MCGYFCTGFIDFMLKGKRLPDYTNLFSSNKIFLITKKTKKLFVAICGNCVTCGKYRKFEIPKYHTSS